MRRKLFTQNIPHLLVLVLAMTPACHRETSASTDLGASDDLSIAANDLTAVVDASSSPDVAHAPDLTAPTCTLCANGGTCVVTVDGASCVCAAGYTGDTCEIDIDDCTPNPCVNGATCVDAVNDYSCTCAAGYTGDTCEIDIDDCTPNPCHNGGTCVDQVNGFACTCASGFLGVTCDDIDYCAPNPCENGGTCVNGSAGFTCNCPSAFGGATCSCPRAPQAADYRALATGQPAAIHDVPSHVHITGSANINILHLNGIGIVGGADNVRIDSGETMDFTFDFPASAVSISAFSFLNLNGSTFAYDIAVEAFSPAGVSLGEKAIPMASTWNLTSMYGGALIGRARVKGNPDGVALGGMSVTYQCD